MKHSYYKKKALAKEILSHPGKGNCVTETSASLREKIKLSRQEEGSHKMIPWKVITQKHILSRKSQLVIDKWGDCGDTWWSLPAVVDLTFRTLVRLCPFRKININSNL